MDSFIESGNWTAAILTPVIRAAWWGPPEKLYDRETAEELHKWALSVMEFVQSKLS